MTELKNKATTGDPLAFIDALDSDAQKADCLRLIDMMKKVTGESPKMWGQGIVGFGSYHYVYNSGREGDWFLTGFGPRKQNLSTYLIAGADHSPELLQQLGKYKTGKGCLYIKNLDTVDTKVLEELVNDSVTEMKRKYPSNAV